MRVNILAALAALVAATAPAAAVDYGPGRYGPGRYGLGRPASAADIAAWDIDVAPDGRGLPPGRGSVAQGAQLFAKKCAACHGAHGEGKPMDALAGGAGSLDTAKPVKTVGSFWPYATTLYDFIHRAMPFCPPMFSTSITSCRTMPFSMPGRSRRSRCRHGRASAAPSSRRPVPICRADRELPA